MIARLDGAVEWSRTTDLLITNQLLTLVVATSVAGMGPARRSCTLSAGEWSETVQLGTINKSLCYSESPPAQCATFVPLHWAETDATGQIRYRGRSANS